jgi:hypothetical protein
MEVVSFVSGMLAWLVVFDAPPPAMPLGMVVGGDLIPVVVVFGGIEDIGSVPLAGGRGIPVALLGGIMPESVVEGSEVICGLRAMNGAAAAFPTKDTATRGRNTDLNNIVDCKKS